MGMFDNVNVRIDCPNCGETVEDFQSKDSYCELGTIDPTRIDRFYGTCDNCNLWIEFLKPIDERRSPHRKEPFNLKEIHELGFVLANKTADT